MTKREELEALGFEAFDAGDLTVFFNPDFCTHNGACVRGYPGLFVPKRDPWFDPSKAPTEEIARVVELCPSGALRYIWEGADRIKVQFEPENSRSAAYDGDRLVGFCQLQMDESDVWVVAHTESDPAYGGRGIAKKLVTKVAEAARVAHKKLSPHCNYAAKVLTEDPAFRELL